MVEDFLKALPGAASSPWALVSYAIAAIVMIYGGLRYAKIRVVVNASKGKTVSNSQLKQLIEVATNTKLPDSITGDQWLINNRNQAVFVIVLAFIMAIAAIGTVAIITLKSQPSVGNAGAIQPVHQVVASATKTPGKPAELFAAEVVSACSRRAFAEGFTTRFARSEDFESITKSISECRSSLQSMIAHTWPYDEDIKQKVLILLRECEAMDSSLAEMQSALRLPLVEGDLAGRLDHTDSRLVKPFSDLETHRQAFMTTLSTLAERFNIPLKIVFTPRVKGPEQPSESNSAAIVPLGARLDRPPLVVTMAIDRLRTSYRSEKKGIVSSTETSSEIAAVYRIPDEVVVRILFGNGHRGDDGRLKFERQYYAGLMKPSYYALQALSNHRGASAPKIPDLGVDEYAYPYFITLTSERKRKFVELGLLPRASEEWEWLERERPRDALALRTLLTEWIGLPDPVFDLTFVNNEDVPQAIIGYSVRLTPLGIVKASLIGPRENGLYVSSLEDGEHEYACSPPIEIAPRSTKSVKWLFELRTPHAGLNAKLEIAFRTAGDQRIKLAPFTIVFFRGKVDDSEFPHSLGAKVDTYGTIISAMSSGLPIRTVNSGRLM